MIGCLITVAAWMGVAAADTPATYTITIAADKASVHVEATFAPADSYLAIREGAYSEGVSGGLAGFIQNLNVVRSDGTAVTVEGPENGRWKIDVPSNEAVTVQYDVRLDHEKQKWPFGADEIAYTRDDGVFFVSRTVLLTNESVRTARVKFMVPNGWHVATPWRPVDGESFDVLNPRILMESCILAGDFIEGEVRTGDTVVRLAVGHALEPYMKTLDSAVHTVVPAFRDVFQDTPQAQFLAVVNAHVSGLITDGSAYPNSVSMLTPRRMEGVNFDQAVYTIAHEILHLWNGYRMRPAKQMEWFREGFTDYLTWRTLANLKLVNEAALLRELKRQVTAYENLDRTVPLAAAGDDKAENSVLVYEGGSLAALCLDSLIRERSGGERGIAEFMRAVYARSALQNATYDDTALVSAAGEIAGQGLQDFFDKHVTGIEPLPLDECLAKMGLRIERTPSGSRTSVTITPDESAKGAAALARDAFLGRG